MGSICSSPVKENREKEKIRVIRKDAFTVSFPPLYNFAEEETKLNDIIMLPRRSWKTFYRENSSDICLINKDYLRKFEQYQNMVCN